MKLNDRECDDTVKNSVIGRKVKIEADGINCIGEIISQSNTGSVIISKFKGTTGSLSEKIWVAFEDNKFNNSKYTIKFVPGSKYPEYIYRDIRQRLQPFGSEYDPKDTSQDVKIDRMSKSRVIEEYLAWNGLINWGSSIISLIEDVYGISLEDLEENKNE